MELDSDSETKLELNIKLKSDFNGSSARRRSPLASSANLILEPNPKLSRVKFNYEWLIIAGDDEQKYPFRELHGSNLLLVPVLQRF